MKWHLVGFLFFNYHNDARRNKHQIQIRTASHNVCSQSRVVMSREQWLGRNEVGSCRGSAWHITTEFAPRDWSKPESNSRPDPLKTGSYLVCKNSQVWQRAMHIERKNESRSRDHCCRGKAKVITYSECVFIALVIQRVKGMRRIILSSVTCVAVQQYFHIFS